jgi:virginiamycin B lyase
MKIGKVTPAGSFSEFFVSSFAEPRGITVGPDANLWFATDPRFIGRITTAGAIDLFTPPTTNGSPFEITTGPDGNLWFTESAGNTIGKAVL